MTDVSLPVVHCYVTILVVGLYRFLQLLSLVPTDPHIHQALGQIFDSEGDKQQAYQYYFDVSASLFVYTEQKSEFCIDIQKKVNYSISV